MISLVRTTCCARPISCLTSFAQLPSNFSNNRPSDKPIIVMLFKIMPACPVTVRLVRLVVPPTAPKNATVLEPASTVREVSPSTVELNDIGLLVEVKVVGAANVTAPPNVIGPVVVIAPPRVDVL